MIVAIVEGNGSCTVPGVFGNRKLFSNRVNAVTGPSLAKNELGKSGFP